MCLGLLGVRVILRNAAIVALGWKLGDGCIYKDF